MPIEPLSSDNFAAFRRFSEEVWDRPRSDAYYRWRYFDAPNLITLIATRGDRCVGSLSAFSRIYYNGDETLECLEAFDWRCLQAVKGSGVGIRLATKMMEVGKPILSLGGSADTMRLIPRMGWTAISEATEFFLPLSSAYLLRNRRLPDYCKRAIAPSLDLAASAWFKPAKPNGSGDCVPLPVSAIDGELAQINGPAGFRSVPDPRLFAWLMRGWPATGIYVPMMLKADGDAVAWIIGRLHRSGGLLHGTILDLRLARQDEAIAVSAITHLARALAGCGADAIHTVTTSVFFAAAYRKCGFLAGRERIPAMAWAGRHKLITDRISWSCFADGAFHPLQGNLC